MSISDLIVVMKDGVVQQIDAPQRVYDDPANLFVAQFLGTPPINVFDATVKDGMLRIGNDEVMEVSLPDGEVTCAVRPEGFLLNENGRLSCQLKAVEVMGRDFSIVFGSDASKSPALRAIVPSDGAATAGLDEVRFDLKPSKVFLFDKKTGERIRQA